MTGIRERIDIRKLLESSSREIREKSCLMENDRLSPFFNPPHQHLHPGVDSEQLFKLHEIYPEVFNGKCGFMGSEPQGRASVDVLEYPAWKNAKEQIFIQEGHFDNDGNFRAPIVCYVINGGIYSGGFVLFQQGSYQILDSSNAELLRTGQVLVHRGLGDKDFFIRGEIGAEDRRRCLEYTAWSFLSPIISLAYNNTGKCETNHVNQTILSRRPKCVRRLEQSFSLWERMAREKFGPNFVTYKTSLDNIRLLTRWTREGEVHLIDPERAERIK